MNCLECQELLQRWLDGEPPAAWHPDLDSHLSACSDCRQLHAAGQRLLDGLTLLTPPAVPPGLAGRISARIVIERRRTRRARRSLAATVLAAGLLLAAFLAYPAKRQGRTIPQAEPDPSAVLASPISLSKGVEEAGLAVVALTRGIADDTVDQGRVLLPVVLPEAGGNTRPVQEGLVPRVDPLWGIRQGVSEGLEPVATSARRALDLFLQEIPSTEPKRRTRA